MSRISTVSTKVQERPIPEHLRQSRCTVALGQAVKVRKACYWNGTVKEKLHGRRSTVTLREINPRIKRCVQLYGYFEDQTKSSKMAAPVFDFSSR
jgi:hypothetical protein